MSFFDPYDLQVLQQDQRDAGDDLATVAHWETRSTDSGGAPDATSATTTYTDVTVRRGARTARSAPGPDFDDTQEQTSGGTRLVIPVLQPLEHNVAVVDAIAVGDEVRLGGKQYTVIDAPHRRTTDIYRAVQIEEVR